MAVAAFAAPALAQSMASAGTGGVDILGQGIFETGGSAFHVPANSHTNFDSVDIGNDNALAIGGAVQFGGPFGANQAAVTAQNNLKIKKNQDSGECQCCQAVDSSGPCQDCCVRYNVEQIKAGSRSATAIGLSVQGPFPFGYNTNSALAQNNVEVATNQQ